MNTLIISKYRSARYWNVKIIENKKEFQIDREYYIVNNSIIVYKKDFGELLKLVDNNECLGIFFENNFIDYYIIICEDGYIDSWHNKKRRL